VTRPGPRAARPPRAAAGLFPPGPPWPTAAAGGRRRSGGCDPDRLSESLAVAFRELVRTRLPADLLDRLDVSIADGDLQIEVGLTREPTEHELERLNEVIATAHAEFRQRLG
jgi:hypothetical protein